MVLDIHHFICNREKGSSIEVILSRFLSTWDRSGLNPKIHVSSPRSGTDRRSHHDFVGPEDIWGFIKDVARHERDIDVMVEAKKKDTAMFRLVEDLAGFPGIRRVNRAALEVLF